ncbi:MAG: homoserine dehydrogenase [Lachnospiraceae bacterium]|nr:homoserine dehydrogenase [Lachnospiraceae bacterium]
MINVAVLGYGTVGSGVVEVIEENKETVNKKSAAELNVKYILDLRDFPGDPYEDKVIHDFNIILNDPEVSIVCETMGGVGAAYKFTKECLLAGKSVCTSNKELVAKHGPELLQIAKDKQCNYLFEASVGGGIPVIRPINYSLTAEEIENITGILNGTTNYMLTKMDALGADFDEVLKEAQANGYAEADPTADIEGYDARRKIAILSSLMMTKNVDSEKVYTEGITKITSADFEYAKAAGFKIKLLGTSEKLSDSEVAVMVAPFFIDLEHPLAMVNDVFNAVFVKGNMLGDSMYYGRGAGKLPTASAVVSDVIDCARHLGKTVMCFWDAEDVKLADVKELEREFFVRIDSAAKEDFEELFEDFEEIIADRKEDAGYFLPPTKERDVYEKLEKLGDTVLNVIRIYR